MSRFVSVGVSCGLQEVCFGTKSIGGQVLDLGAHVVDLSFMSHRDTQTAHFR